MWVTQFYDTRIVYGEGSLEHLRELQLSDVVVVTTRSLLDSPLLKEVVSSLRNFKIVRGPSQHTPKEELESLSSLIENKVVLSLGGGSVIDAVKLSSPRFHISIPTTLSGAEHTAVAGYSEGGLKKSARVTPPNVVILDPTVLRWTPRRLLVTTAFRALDHAVEARSSTRSSPFTDALASKGYEYLVKCLESWDLGLCQVGTWLASLSFMYAGRGLSHVFGYVFGPAFNIPHGVTSCISLVEAVKFNGGAKKLGNVVETLEALLEKHGVKERLSNYSRLDDALKYSRVLKELTNSSENPRKMTDDDAVRFIRSVY
ncbi:MAG: iron-containing alcohol dehydrogenase [Metallosphaera sp.]|uniref:iron-containing alcohol dehydrogenase n=1 Tax=Metallosphaera sp. TaxID=2020860 RepID=UPI00317C3484